MVACAKKRYITPQEYLRGERKASAKSEYHDIVAVEELLDKEVSLLVEALLQARGIGLSEKLGTV